MFAQDEMNMCNLINRHASLTLYCAFLKNGNLQGVLKYNDTSGLKRQTDSGDFKAFQSYSLDAIERKPRSGKNGRQSDTRHRFIADGSHKINLLLKRLELQYRKIDLCCKKIDLHCTKC